MQTVRVCAGEGPLWGQGFRKSECLSLRKVFKVKFWPAPLFRHFLAGGRRGGEVVERFLEFLAGGGGTRLISSSFSFVSFRCWQQNINMNFWWIIRSPILLAVVVISSVLCICCMELLNWHLCLVPKIPEWKKKKKDLPSTHHSCIYNIKHTPSIIHELQKGCRGFEAYMGKNNLNHKGSGITVRFPFLFSLWTLQPVPFYPTCSSAKVRHQSLYINSIHQASYFDYLYILTFSMH